MLRSVRKVFEIIGREPESINFTKEELNADNLVNALTQEPRKCPAIVTLNITSRPLSAHIMVATNALKGFKFIHRYGQDTQSLLNKWFINCKNSCRDDMSEPGTV